MHGNEFLAGYSAKLVEYGLAVAYLLLFVGFWRFVHGGARTAHAEARKPAELPRTATAGWFSVPEDVALHPGHTWARLEPDGTVAVGLDELGHRMIGTPDAVRLPAPGGRVEQGSAAVTLEAGGRKVGLLSPVDGEVVAANPASARDGVSPYGDGWLFKVRPSRWLRDRAQLLSGQAARDWVEEQGRRLTLRLAPEMALATALHDGGAPLHGMARELDAEHWDEVAREFFRTQE
jgi:glycine cleavage system H lipoate-binding protein